MAIIKKNYRVLFYSASFIFISVVLFLFFSLGLVLANRNKIIAGAAIADIDIGRLDKTKAKNKINDEIQKFLDEKIFIEYRTPDETKKEIMAGGVKEIGVEFDIETTINNVFALGRSQNVFENLKTHLETFFRGRKIDPVFTLYGPRLEKYIEKYLKPRGEPARNAAIVFEKNDFVIQPEKEGVIIPQKEVENQVISMSRDLKIQKLNIALVKDVPEVAERETEFALELAKDYLKIAPLILKYEDNSIPISKERLADLFEFPVINQPGNESNKILGFNVSLEKTKDLLTLFSQGINRESNNAQFVAENGKVTTFRQSFEGLRLNIDASSFLLKQSILAKKKETELAVSKIQPDITTAGANNLGVVDLLGRGTTDFTGSPESRVHNIKTAAAKFNGILIKPGEKFSFNKILGEVTPEEGYRAALVIKDHQTIPEYGGGICQVSTTVFRAAIFSGLDIIERYPHSYAVKYYNPQGFDATVYPGGPDLKFINNTERYILIQTKIAGNKLIIEFYGTKDGRSVKIKGPQESNKQKDESLKAELFYEVWRGDELIAENYFLSNYFSPKLFPIARNPLE
ncbi:MAG: VanW family protein [Parcubacteria group bacterium]|nr:VanW family protein [Parcubacteria group bacterium]